METLRAKPPKLSRQFVRDREWVSEHMQELIANYPNQWVLVHKGEVIAEGDKAWSLWHNANELGLGQPYISFIEREMHVY